MRIVSLLTSAALLAVLPAVAQSLPGDPTGGRPPYGATASVPDLDQQVAYQRAFEATLWAMPALGIWRLREGFMGDIGMANNDIASFSGPLKQTMEAITPNTVTPYILAFTDLRDGPVVLEVPAAGEKASLYGQIVDAWQITIADVGPAGVDAGKGAKYLLTPPDYRGEVPAGYVQLASPSYRVGFAFRSVQAAGASARDAYDYTKQLAMYPLAKAEHPPEQKFLDGRDIVVRTLPRYGLETLQDIHDIAEVEPVRPRDKVMMGMLKSIGIEKGKDFDPPPVLRPSLERGVWDAYFYMQEQADKLFASNLYWGERHWSMVMKPDADSGFDFETDTMLDIDARAAAWHFFTFYPRTLSDQAGTVYLAPIADQDGRLLEAGANYRLRVPADVPVKQFWSLTLYDHATWGFIRNPEAHSGLSSLDKDNLQVNQDGSIDLYVGPDAPKGMTGNWLPTEGKRPYLWFRLYGPRDAFWHKSFVMPDIVRLDRAEGEAE